MLIHFRFFDLMKKVSLFLSIVLITLIVYSCKKDFSIYAPGEPITIVTGFLDPSQDTQFVKINKTWQGNGNNLEYAMIRDSSEYKWEEFNSITIKEIVDGQVLNTYNLLEIELHDKDTGMFYGPNYTAYYFVKPDDFLEEATYRLDVDFKNQKDVWSETNIVLSDVGLIDKPNPSFKVSFGTVSNAGIINFKDYKPRWYPYNNAGRYSASFDIHYKEMVWANANHTDLISEENKVIHWDIGDKETDDLIDGRYQLTVPGEAFYQLLAANMEVNPLISRELGFLNAQSLATATIDFNLSVANEDFNDFIVVNQPSTTIVQERPQYTNINNGIGIFASRVNVKVKDIELNYTTYNVIPWIAGMGELNICTPEITANIHCD